MHRVRLLKHHKITPYIVFDGGPLPAKKGTESSRHASREANREKGLKLSREGRHSEARECFVKAVDVTPEMAYQLIKVSSMFFILDLIPIPLFMNVTTTVLLVRPCKRKVFPT